MTRAEFHSYDPPSVVIRLALLSHIQSLLQSLNEERKECEKQGSRLIDRESEIDKALRDIHASIPAGYVP